MDYKYIEQLLERYWECQTTLKEEAILHSFFAQSDIPAKLLPYRDLFQAEEEIASERLGDDFDEKVLNAIEKKEERTRVAPIHTVRPTSFAISQRLAPFYRAAAIVAVVLTIGMAAQQGFRNNDGEEATPTDLSALTPEADTIQLFTNMPEPMQQTEAVLSTPQTDTLIVMK